MKMKNTDTALGFAAMTVRDRVKLLAQLLIILAAPAAALIYRTNSVAFVVFLFSLMLLNSVKIPKVFRLAIAAVDLVIIMPLMGLASGTFAYVATMIGVYAILSMGLNIVVGYTGLLNLGYAAFYAVGAYTYAIFASRQASNFMTVGTYPLSGHWFWLFLIIGFIVTGIVGFLLGLPVLRLKGDYLAIVTLGFAEIIRLLFNNLNEPVNLTNGPMGITPIQAPRIFNMVLNKPVHFYGIVLFLFVLVVLLVKNLNNSRLGRAWVAIREDELVARTMGVPVVRLKLLSFTIAAGLAGMMGVLFAALQSYIDPTSFTFTESIIILCMVILGGTGSQRGVIIGALLVVVLQLQILKDVSTYFTELTASGVLNISARLNPAKYEKLVFGLILVLMCVFRPKGIFPEIRKLSIGKKKAGQPEDWRR